MLPSRQCQTVMTEWTSSDRESRHIWLNVVVAKKDPDCLEHIVAQEMRCNRGARLTKLMNQSTRDRRGRLGDVPIADEQWSKGTVW